MFDEAKGRMRETEVHAYYREYWAHRQALGKIHTRDGMWIPKRLEAALRLLSPPEAGEFRLLDLGCGEGTLGKLLGERFGARVRRSGCDISDQAVALARPHYEEVHVVEFGRQDLAALQPAGPFDYVVCLDVLEHLFDPAAALALLEPLVTPRTTLIASFPNFAWWQYRLDLLRGRFPVGYTMHRHTEHVQHFTCDSFRVLLAGCGWRAEALDGHWELPWLMKKLLPWRLHPRVGRRWPGLFGYQIVMRAGRASASPRPG